MQSIDDIIDVHSHIIPDLDDGSRNMAETRKLLELASEQGIHQIIATPHYIHGHNKMPAKEILELLKTVKAVANEIDSRFEIYQGAELYYYSGIISDLDNGKALTLGNTRYVLVEFHTSVTYREVVRAVREFTQACYIPVLAHVERYQALREGNSIDELTQMGAYMQMSFPSLSDSRHLITRHWCRQMVKMDKIHLLGTDMHRFDTRPPKVYTASKWLLKEMGRAYFKKLTNQNPAILLSGEFI